MIEKIVLDYLNSVLDVPVYMERPEDPDSKYVLLEKTGSGRSNHINRATIAAQSYALTKYEAAELNEAVKAAMDNIIVLDSIARSALNSDYDFTDTRSKQYRYQAVYDIVHY